MCYRISRIGRERFQSSIEKTTFTFLLTNSAGQAFVPDVENAEITKPSGLKEDVTGDGIVNIQELVLVECLLLFSRSISRFGDRSDRLTTYCPRELRFTISFAIDNFRVDRTLVAGYLGKSGTNSADVNGDGIVNIQDLVLVASALGSSATAPSLHLQSLDTLTASDVKKWLSEAQQLNLTDATSVRGILFLQQLLNTLTPKKTALLPNFPNPFNPETWIPYQLAKHADVSLPIYDIRGKLVRTLDLGNQRAGLYQTRTRAAYWDGRNNIGEKVASGVYFYMFTAGDFSATRKMTITK